MFSSSTTGGNSITTVDDDPTDTSPCPAGTPETFTQGPDHAGNLPASPPAPPVQITYGPSYEEYDSSLETPDEPSYKRVILELKDDANTECLNVLKDIGCKIEVYVFNLVQISIDERRLDYLKQLNFVNHLRFPTESENNSKYLSAAPTIGLTDFSALNLNEIHKNGYLGQGIKVAVLDTGFEPNNPLFKNNIFYTISFRSKDKDIRVGDVEHGNAVTEILTSIARKQK